MIASVIPDTSFILDFPDLLELNWILSPLEIVISETVVSEVVGLTNNSDPNRAKKAQRAFEEIRSLQMRSELITSQFNEITIRFEPRITDAKPPLDYQKPDHQIIAFARRQLFSDPPKFCAILTSDRELCDIAEALSVIVIIPDPKGKFYQEIARKFEWWKKAREVEIQQSSNHQEKDQKNSQSPNKSDQSVFLEQTIQQIYQHVRAEHHRAMIHLVPLQARISLTTKIIRHVHRPDSRLVLVIVNNPEDAFYWAKVIRQGGSLHPSDIHVFGQDNIERLEKARAIIYHHDQAIRRLPQHISRLEQARKNLTAIVDACELLDPIGLAQLFFECDQFIGYHHSPTEDAQASGGRMLASFLRNKSLLSYTFADAECDGWGHPYDLYLNPVEFTAEERDHWDGVSRNFLNLRERAINNHPELENTDDFWGALYKLLQKTVAPAEAKLLYLREEQEGIAILAQQKIQAVEKLLDRAPNKPYRRLIVDYEKQWTPVLLKQFEHKDVNVTELPNDDNQLAIWNQFIGNKWDTLLLSHAPDQDLPGGHYHQVIIMTPYRAIADINSIVDWALSHTFTKDALRIDIIYVKNTLEELSILSLAETSFGLHYKTQLNAV